MELKDFNDTNINDLFRCVKVFCSNLKKEELVLSRDVLAIDKKQIIIIDADIDKIDLNGFSNEKDRELLLPYNNLLIQIPKWFIRFKECIVQNQGGILFFKNNVGCREIIHAYSIWGIYDKSLQQIGIKPIRIGFMDKVYLNKEDINKEFESYAVGSNWKNASDASVNLDLQDLQKEIASIIKKITYSVLIKIEKKEYTSYKKWTPSGFETKEIVYAKDVCTHKRHFWTDTDYFNIPKTSKEEWEKNGYGTDELVFRGNELRRDVPFVLIGQYIQGKDKQRRENNRVINLFNKKMLRQEEKIYLILRELYPDKIIRRHDRKTLKGIELDFNIPELRLGIEYDGEQHFDKELYEKLYGEGFEEQVRRDREKDKLCRRKDIKLIRIKYDEPITLSHIRKKVTTY